ncbi:hypothetical protein WK59_33600 [Burkholderia ubonensis]|uniref:hypothetical protein n=1 Tax=Burkholderia ubonensis TaxID=101571 RepID=UPI0007575A22|nr:hypothetical protein [Burkholderia ubonensis]KVT92933.1 hypothetical protein WK59_33600 [Burkholderia ubonensis]
MKTAIRRWIRRIVIGIILSGVIAAGLVAYGYPAVTATVCAACYGMEQAAPRLIVDRDMPPRMRDALSANAKEAESLVRAFYGMFDLAPIIVACSTDECDRRMGGRGALATTTTTPFAIITRVSPRGQNPTILAHEFSLVELHRRIGWRKLANGAMPVWFDEGVAVIVSDDARYLNPGTTAAERCVRESASALPSSPAEWGPRAGKDRMIYADAACRVLQWMDAHGGRDGLLRTIDAAARDETFNPR